MTTTSEPQPADYDDVLAAQRVIAPHTHITPVLTSSYFDNLLGASLFFKCENLQKVGAFKARGACNAVFGLDEVGSARGVVTHSSGNHGQALAYAAGKRGIPAFVVMPHSAAEAKKAAVKGYGGEVVECEANDEARQAAVDQLVSRTGGEFVHPFNDTRVIAGQGTCAVELFDQAGPLDTLIAPIGGGGLISGCCLTARAISTDTRVVGAEPKEVDDAARSLRAGSLVQNESANTIADGLKTNLQPLTWHFISQYVTDIVTATEPQIVEAMRLVWQRMKIVIEPSSAVPLAAMLAQPASFRGQRVGVILSGGNVDLNKLPWQ